MTQPTANWEAFALQVPVQDLLEPVRAILEVLVIFLEILKTLLEVVKVLLILFANAVIALVEALISLILTFLEALKRTGLYIWWDIPDLLHDPNLNRNYGGYLKFLQRFKGSCLDIHDVNRPQPIAGATQSGFLLLVVDVGLPTQMIQLIMILLRFFGKEIMSPQFKAPANVKVLPAASDGGPVLTLEGVFSTQPPALVIEWGLPGTQTSGDLGHPPVIGDFVNEFIPPFFVIEKSTVNPATTSIDVSQLNTTTTTTVTLPNGGSQSVVVGSAGGVTMTVPTNNETNGQPGQTIMKSIVLPDYYNQPFFKFQTYINISTTANLGTFILGQLGTFRYIDNDVLPGQTYYYRVRAHNGDLQVNTSNNTIAFSILGAQSPDPLTGRYFVAYPSTTGAPTANVGRPSPIHQATVPILPAPPFDTIACLKAIFELAFSFNFHLPLPAGSTFDPKTGLPTGNTPPAYIGLASLSQLAGSLVAFQAVPLLGEASGVGTVVSTFAPNPATGVPPQQPWQVSSVTRNANRLAQKVASGMINANAVLAFQKYLQSFPATPVPDLTGTNGAITSLAVYANLEQFVLGLTPAATTPPNLTAMQQANTVYGNAFSDPGSRLNTLAAVNYVKQYLLTGAPPNWKQVSLLRDIIPWAGQIIYELIAKIQALLAAFQGLIQEIIAFINLIERKINVLEQFIEYLISILNLLLSLELGLFVLFVPQLSGDITSWFAAIDGAQGTVPTSGPTGYTCGIAIGYIAVDVTAFATALKLIF
jgi:hypothetical protein